MRAAQGCIHLHEYYKNRVYSDLTGGFHTLMVGARLGF